MSDHIITDLVFVHEHQKLFQEKKTHDKRIILNLKVFPASYFF